jgi:hypothetical protein
VPSKALYQSSLEKNMKDQVLQMSGDFAIEFEAYVKAGVNKMAGLEVMATTAITCESLGCTFGC